MAGYIYCACPGCFEIIVGDNGDYCDECLEAGCDDSILESGLEGDCLVNRCACGGNIDRGECFCDEGR